MRELNTKELEQVGGGMGLVGAGVGAAMGAGGYTLSSFATGASFNPGAMVMSAGLGAVSGFTGNVAGVAAAAGRPIAAGGLYTASVTAGIGTAGIGPLTSGGFGGPAPASSASGSTALGGGSE